jgi:hypothetical protein
LALKRKVRSLMLWIFCLASFVWASSSPSVEAGNLQIEPQSIEIGTFFNGAQITLSDAIPQNCEAVVEVIGKVVEEDLMRKGRRWELWMNVGEIDIKGAPSFYILASSAPQLLGDGGSHPWGYHALSKRVSFKGRHLKEEESVLFTEFIQLKQGQGVYGRYPGALRISPLNAKEAMVRGAFHLPSRISPGTYQVCLNVIKNKQITERRCIPLEVGMAGFPLFLSSLASRHVVLYGFLCVATAVASGFLSGVFFRKIRLRSKLKEKR